MIISNFHHYLDCIKYPVIEKRKGIYQIIVPVIYNDGDGVCVYVEDIENKLFLITDHAMTIMRMSFEDIDLDHLTNKYLTTGYGVRVENSNIFVNLEYCDLYTDINDMLEWFAKQLVKIENDCLWNGDN